MSVTAIVKLTSLPGQRDALVSAMAPAVEATRAQPACLAADLLAGIENPDELMLVEHWTSVVAHEKFIDGMIADGGLGDIMPLLAGELESSHYR
ncbi:MAG: hypothetical protein GWP63_20845 [Haliea sp.]|jgi:quinol monooxygenase YgiN|nr:hypothetical protein [Haliea sp.]